MSKNRTSSPKYVYHVTDKHAATKILQSHCLQPKQGHRTQMTGDVPGVYLCQRKDIAIWQLLLGKTTTLQIPLTDIPDTYEIGKYDGYKEYVVKQPIQSKRIKDVSKRIHKKELDQANQTLCCSQLWQISHICHAYAEHYTKPYSIPHLTEWTKAVLFSLKRLNYRKANPTQLKATIDNMREEYAFAFTDTYCNTENRLREQLICYPKDETTEIRQELHAFIKNNLKTVYHEDTGGYTA